MPRRTKLKLYQVSTGRGRQIWCVEYPKSTGPGRNREYFKDSVEAEKCRKEKAIGIANGGIEGVLTSHERYLFHECRKALEPFDKTLRDATEFYIEHLKATSKSCSASQLVDGLIAAKRADGASQRHVDDLRRLNLFAEKFNGQPVSTITAAAIDDWLRSLAVSAVTRNHYRRLVILAFNFAVQRKYAAENPAKDTAKAKEDAGNIGILTVAQSARLLESATPDVLPYIAIGLFAGMRRAELERLDWSEIDFESGLIEVTAKNAKTARRRHVTIQPNLREWLLPLCKHKGNVTPRENFRELFDQARESAGIVDWPDNALRHSFASYHLACFRDAKALALEMGHTNEDMIFTNYRQLVKPADAEQYWQIVPKEQSNEISAQRDSHHRQNIQ